MIFSSGELRQVPTQAIPSRVVSDSVVPAQCALWKHALVKHAGMLLVKDSLFDCCSMSSREGNSRWYYRLRPPVAESGLPSIHSPRSMHTVPRSLEVFFSKLRETNLLVSLADAPDTAHCEVVGK